MGTLIEFREVCKYYQMGDTTVKAADHISFQIRKGEFVAIVGQSGSGKSTCMNIIGCLDVPTSGTYLLDGRDVGQMDKDQLAAIQDDPAFASLSAVQNGSIHLIMLGDIYASGPRTIDGLRTLAQGMYSGLEL